MTYIPSVTEQEIERHLRPVAGYLELGMAAEALQELERIPCELHSLTGIMEWRLAVYSALKNWDMAAKTARELLSAAPDDLDYTVNLAYAVRRLSGIAEAEPILLEALKKHPEMGILYYNLACYSAQTERLEEAGVLLKQAIHLDSKLKKLALDDPDLQEIR